jgi:predicted RNA-binding protein with PUA-like domain
VITHDEPRKHADDVLAAMILLYEGNRLSVSELRDAHWRCILTPA